MLGNDAPLGSLVVGVTLLTLSGVASAQPAPAPVETGGSAAEAASPGPTEATPAGSPPVDTPRETSPPLPPAPSAQTLDASRGGDAPPPPPSGPPPPMAGVERTPPPAAATTAASSTAVKEPAPPKAAPVDPDDYNHEGFYLRVGVGPAFINNSIQTNVGFLEGRKLRLRGGGMAFDLDIGGTPFEGWVVGVGFTGTGGGVGSLRDGSGNLELAKEAQMSLSGLKAFVVYYPNPRKGLHFGAALGYGSFSVDSRNDIEKGVDIAQPDGAFIVGSGGYEWFTGRDVSLGVMTRVTYAPLEIRNEDLEENHRIIVLALMGALTWH